MPASVAGLALAGVVAFTPPPDPPDDTHTQSVTFQPFGGGEPITCTVYGTTGAYGGRPSGSKARHRSAATPAASRLFSVSSCASPMTTAPRPGSSHSDSASVVATTHLGASLGRTEHGASFLCEEPNHIVCEPRFTTQPK